MARYTIYPKLVIEIDTPRTPAQIRNALIGTAPSLRDALKSAIRTQMLKDPTGQTRVVSWHFHINQAAGSLPLDLNDGLPNDQVEP